MYSPFNTMFLLAETSFDAVPAMAVTMLRNCCAVAISGMVAWLLLRYVVLESPFLRRCVAVFVVLQGWVFFRWTAEIPWYEQPAAVVNKVEAVPAVSRVSHPNAEQNNAIGNPSLSRENLDTQSKTAAQPTLESTVKAGTASAPAAPTRFSWLTTLFLVWLSGMAVIVSVASAMYGRVCRIVRNEKRVDPSEFLEWREAIAASRLELGQRVSLCFTAWLGPSVVHMPGEFVVLVPRELWQGLNGEERQAVLRHELAHVARGDLWKSFLLRMLALPQWFNPLSWWAVSVFDEAAEWACDQIALESQLPAQQYSHLLVQVSSNSFAYPAHSLGASAKRLAARVRRLVEPSSEYVTTKKRMFLAVVAAVLLVANVLNVRLVERSAVAEPPAARVAETSPGNSEEPIRFVCQTTDAETHKPLAGVDITATFVTDPGDEQENIIESNHYESDADGKYTLILPTKYFSQKDLYLRVVARREGYLSSDMKLGGRSHPVMSVVSERRDGRNSDFQEIALPKSRPLTGRLLNPEGSPLPNQTVRLSSRVPTRSAFDNKEYFVCDARTDEQGRFKTAVCVKGKVTLFVMPPAAVPLEREIAAELTDLGDVQLQEGVRLRGQLLDLDGKPVPKVGVNVETADNETWGDVERTALTDNEGRFEFGPLAPGRYEVVPCHEYRPREDGGSWMKTPLPGVWDRQIVVLKRGKVSESIKLKAGQHIAVTAGAIDSQGKPLEMSRFSVSGDWDNDAKQWWSSNDSRSVTGSSGQAQSLLIPRGLVNARLFVYYSGKGANRVQLSPDQPFSVDSDVMLPNTKADLSEIVFQKFESAVLTVRVKAAVGELPYDFRVLGEYLDHEKGGTYFNRSSAGVYLKNAGIVPDERMQISVSADGFDRFVTDPIVLAEGESRTIDVTLLPKGTDPEADKKTHRRPNKDADGLTPVQKSKPLAVKDVILKEKDALLLSCQAVDDVTGEPIAGGIVEISFNLQHELGVSHPFDEDLWMRRMEAISDSQGQFTVPIPKWSQMRPKLQVRIELVHPRYLRYFDHQSIQEIVSNGPLETFKHVKATPAREIVGRLLQPDGQPMANVHMFKEYNADPFKYVPNDRFIRDGDSPTTDEEGRFRCKVAATGYVAIRFRPFKPELVERPYVMSDNRDQGDIYLSRGTMFTGQVLTSEGEPLQNATVSALMEGTNMSPITDCDVNGRFKTAAFGPGKHAISVHWNGPKSSKPSILVTNPPELYLPAVVDVSDKDETYEIIFRPIEHVQCIARVVVAQPFSGNEALLNIAFLSVTGNYQGKTWTSTGIDFANVQNDAKTYRLLAPKGLADAELSCGQWPERIQLRENSPLLFGDAIKIGQLDADLTDIRVHRYRETSFKLRIKSPSPRPADLTVKAAYAREAEMRAAGMIFRTSEAAMGRAVTAEEFKYLVLPDEEIEFTVAAKGYRTVVEKGKLKEGETKVLEVTLISTE